MQGIDTLDQLAEVKAVVTADHPADAAGRCSTATTRGSSRCGSAITRAAVWSSPATRTRRRCARCSTRAAGRRRVIDGWISVLDARRRPRPAGRGRRRADDAGRAVARSTSRTPWPPPAPPWRRAAARGGGRGAAVVPARTPEHNPGRMNIFDARRRHRRDRPRPQRGRPRGAARDDARRCGRPARGCCWASAPSATAPTR